LWTMPFVNSPKLWDIFCKVIDNYGDIGVCWRLACDLAARGHQVRLWADDSSALKWMAPAGCDGVEVRAWTQPPDLCGVAPGDVLIEAFGCEVAPEFIAACACPTGVSALKHTWINLEYLTAEGFAQRSHGLPSPVMSGPGKGLVKHFFYPGFVSGTGGLIREGNLLGRQRGFYRDAWLQSVGLAAKASAGTAPSVPTERLVSLFCYEPTALPGLLQQLAADKTPTRLLVTQGRAATAVKTALKGLNSNEKWPEPSYSKRGQLSILYLPQLSQWKYDELLWACDLNFVRGEDSLVRAMWAGKPFIWNIYPQSDDAHHAKLNALLDVMGAPPSLRQFHQRWNGLDSDEFSGATSGVLPVLALDEWQTAATEWRCQLLRQADLTTQLLEFVARTQ
jgi:uncharacterized repeat protein (TIGR03837 family)